MKCDTVLAYKLNEKASSFIINGSNKSTKFNLTENMVQCCSLAYLSPRFQIQISLKNSKLDIWNDLNWYASTLTGGRKADLFNGNRQPVKRNTLVEKDTPIIVSILKQKYRISAVHSILIPGV